MAVFRQSKRRKLNFHTYWLVIMDVTPLVKDNAQIIQSYAGGGFRVSGVRYDGPVFVGAATTIAWDDVAGKDVKSLEEGDFQALIDESDAIDVVLLGTGEQLVFPEPALKKALREKGLVIEVMDTGAACRTYNVLMAEGRRVVAALLTF